MALTIFRSSASFQQHDIVEAIASWTEDMRDVVAASSGIIDAIVATAQRPPAAIAEPVMRLAAVLHYQPLEDSLREFADDIAHPTCDFVVAALLVSSQYQAREMSSLLTHLATCTRAECELYMRIWVSRARSRTAVRIVFGAVGAFFAAMALFSGAYLQPYFSRHGALVLFAISASFAISAWWMTQIAHIQLPQRFLAQRQSLEAR